MKVVLYLEGGGDSRLQAAPLRQAMITWIERALPQARGQVRVVACGGRASAYEDFCTGLERNRQVFCMLLVDSEEALKLPPWQHVRQRRGDDWGRPPGTGEDNLHFMAQVMETWLVADPEALSTHFGDGFNVKKLPGTSNLEEVSKQDIQRKLDEATRHSRRGAYHKGRDFGLLGRVDPEKSQRRCSQAARLVRVLREKL